MKNLVLAGALALAFGVSPAHATLQIAFTDGLGHIVACADGGLCDFSGATHDLLTLDTDVGDFHVFGTLSTSVSGAVNNLNLSAFTIVNEGSSAGTLTMIVGDTNFMAPASRITESASLTFNNDVGALGSSLGFFADVANGQPAGPTLNIPGLSLFTANGVPVTDPDSFSGTHSTPVDFLGPFSMTEFATLSLKGGGTITGFNESMTSGVPEPRTWAMLAIGFGLMALLGVKRKSARFAV